MTLFQWLPPEGMKILLVLFLSFLTGLEREEHKTAAEQYAFGGVRTYPFIGLIGYAMSLISGKELLPVAVGFAVVGGFLMLSYSHKLKSSETAGITSEVSALATYLVGALVQQEQYWIAVTLSVTGMLLLELKAVLENLTKKIPPGEILTFTKFLVLTAVILPILPNRNFGQFQINPFKTWLVVVAVSAISYGSYVINKLTKGQGGVLMAAILGGAYSSTATTVVMSRRAAQENRPHLFSGGILMASGMMYLRLALLLALLNRSLVAALGPAFALLACVAIGTGWFWSRRKDADAGDLKKGFEARNPLEVRVALLFAAIFLLMLVATQLAARYLGKAGVYSLAAIMGAADVDPFVMGMTQSGGGATPLMEAAAAILIAAASNNVSKGIYAYAICRQKAGVESLVLLFGLALLGLVPLFWLWR